MVRGPKDRGKYADMDIRISGRSASGRFAIQVLESHRCSTTLARKRCFPEDRCSDRPFPIPSRRS